jgi:surface antigen
MRNLLLAGAAALLLSGTAAVAQPSGSPPGDPDGYYSQSDRDGYYDRSGRYHRFNENDNNYDNNDDDNDNAAPPPPVTYNEGAYEDTCRRGNTAAGTIFGAIAGGLIGSAASHGNGGAVVGGAILGGLLGNAVTHDMPCEDHPHAFRAYSEGLNGDLGRRYEWRHGDDYGYFTPEREFNRGRTVCRSWSETTYARGRNFTRSGTACRRNDGNWHFDD